MSGMALLKIMMSLNCGLSPATLPQAHAACSCTRQLIEGLVGASPSPRLRSALTSLQGCWSESRLSPIARGKVMTSGSPRAWKWALFQQSALEEHSFPGTAFSWLPGLPENTGLDLRTLQHFPLHVGWEWPLWLAFRRMSQERAWWCSFSLRPAHLAWPSVAPADSSPAATSLLHLCLACLLMLLNWVYWWEEVNHLAGSGWIDEVEEKQ